MPSHCECWAEYKGTLRIEKNWRTRHSNAEAAGSTQGLRKGKTAIDWGAAKERGIGKSNSGVKN